MTKQSPKRSGGRAARVELRSAPKPVFNPAPSGGIGGQYRPLSDSDVTAIIQAAFEILSTIGMGETPDRLLQFAGRAGCEVTADGRLLFTQPYLEDVIDRACKKFTFFGRDKKHDFEVGGDRVYFGTGGAAVQTLDLDCGLYREATLQDLYDFARLADQLDNVKWFTRCCVATDVPDIYDLDINTAYALLRGTTKPVGTSFTTADTVDPIIEMFDIALGGAGKFAKRPFCKAHISPVISPLRYGQDAVDVAFKCVEHNIPINAIIAAQSGATAPAAPAGMLAHSLAETLAALAMVDLIKPGYPMIFSNWPFVIDLRTGGFSGSGGEISMMNAAAGQLSNALGLPSGVAASMADAKAIDAQMGAEKALSLAAAGLAGANMIYESAGMSASLLGASFEAFILDNETISHVNRLIRGIEVNTETLGIEAIRDVVAGEGHFLGADATMAAMERDYFYPKLADRNDPQSWSESGAKTVAQAANEEAKSLLSLPDPGYVDKAADAKIRETFNILLSA